MPSCLLLTVVGPIQWARGNPQAVYYTLAWGAVTLGSAITAANKYGLIATSFFSVYGMQLGSAFQAILLSLALAIRIYHERQEKVLAQEAELKALEARRAAELRLMDQALHHPLTGLPNRSSYEMRLNELIRSQRGKRFGVVIIHLDNLYAVTKTLGHRNTDRILELASKHYNAVIKDVPGAISLEQTDNRTFFLASLDPQTFAFVVDADVDALTLVNAAMGADKALIDDVRVFDEFIGGALGEGKKSLALTVRMQPSDKTLKDADIEAVGAKVIDKVTKASGGVLRG
jgi:GGDEF domain-containing protein